nr:hypothetical protein [Tanacetum cinerariifolium]
MAPLTFADTHNMIAFLSKSDASAGFDQIVDFLNAQFIHYALMVNPTIYVSCIKQFWATASIKKVFANMTRIGKVFSGVETPLFATMLVQPHAVEEEEDEEDEVPAALTPPLPTYKPLIPPHEPITSPPQAQPAPPSSPPQEQPTTTSQSDMTLLNTLMKTWGIERKDDDNAADKEVNVVEPTVFNDEEVTMTMAQTLIKRKAKKARILDEQMAKRLHDEEVEQAAVREKQEQDDFKRAQEKYQSLKRKPIFIAQARKNMIVYLKNMAGYKIADFKGMTYDQSFEDMLKDFDREDLDALWRLVKEKISTAMPTEDKENALWVELKRLYEPTAAETCTTLSHKVTALEQDKVAQALEIIKLKKRVKRLENKRRSKHFGLKRLRKVGGIERKDDDNATDKEVNVVEPTVFNDKEVTMTMAQTLIKRKAKKARILDEQMAKRLHDEEVEQAAMQEKHLDNIRKYQSLKRKPIFVAQARKNIIVYFKNMAGYKIADFKGMTYDQSFEDMLKDFDREDLDALWRLVKEKFSTAMPTEDKENALWVELKRLYEPTAAEVFWKLQRYMHDPLTWKLYTNCGVHQVSSTRRYDIFMFTEKDYPLTDAVLLLMLSTKLQVDEDCEMAWDLMMKIFMEANKPKSKRSLDTSSK